MNAQKSPNPASILLWTFLFLYPSCWILLEKSQQPRSWCYHKYANSQLSSILKMTIILSYDAILLPLPPSIHTFNTTQGSPSTRRSSIFSRPSIYLIFFHLKSPYVNMHSDIWNKILASSYPPLQNTYLPGLFFTSHLSQWNFIPPPAYGWFFSCALDTISACHIFCLFLLFWYLNLLFFSVSYFFLYKQAQVSPILRTNYSTTCPSLTFTHPSILSFKVKLSLRCLLFPLMITHSLLNPFLVFTPFILWKRFLLLCSVP